MQDDFEKALSGNHAMHVLKRMSQASDVVSEMFHTGSESHKNYVELAKKLMKLSKWAEKKGF